MDNNINNDFQFELFSGGSRSPDSSPQGEPLIKGFAFPKENVIIGSIVLIMLMVFAFSLGVERGKFTAALQKMPDAKIGVEQNSENDIIVRPLVADPDNSADEQVIRIEGIDDATGGSGEIQEAGPEIPQTLEDFYTIQVASFKQRYNAQKEADSLKNIGHESFIVPKGNYTIVCVGRFAQRDDARAFTRKLKTKYSDCLVRRL